MSIQDAMAEEWVRSFAAGCDGHITKPLDQVELLSAIQTQMRIDREAPIGFDCRFDLSCSFISAEIYK